MTTVTITSKPTRITVASKGVQGAVGSEGPQGIQGPKGDTGDVTPEAIAARDAAQEAADDAVVARDAAVSARNTATGAASAASGSAADAAASAVAAEAARVGAVGAARSYATRASLPAASGFAEGYTVWVNNDPTPANNGTWAVLGGVWVQSADRVTGLEGRASDLEKKDTLIRALWDLPWLDKAMLTRFGGTSADFDRADQPYRLMAAQAIKDIQLEGADPGEQYQIVTMAVGDAVSQDKIIIRNIANTVTFADSGNVTFSKNPNGPTRVQFATGTNQVTMWIDYREITATGVLVNSVNSPLRISRTTAHSILADRVRENEADLSAATQTANAASAAAAPLYGVYIIGGAPPGLYPAARAAKASGAVTSFHGEVLAGGGWAEVEVIVGGVSVGGFNFAGTHTEAINVAVAEGDDVSFLVLAAAGIDGLWLQVSGSSA